MFTKALSTKAFPSGQHGVATILMVSLLGFTLAAMATAVMFSVKSTQSKQIAAQAQVHSQAAVWTAAEAFRLYLSQLDAAQIDKITLGGKDPFPKFLGDSVTIKPEILKKDAIAAAGTEPAHTKFEVLLLAIDEEAGSSSALELVYKVFPSGTGVMVQQDGAVFQKGLATGGDVTVATDANEPLNITINDGSGVFNGKLSGVNIVRATENLELNSETDVQEAYANGNISITGAGKIHRKAAAMGNIHTDVADCVVGSAYANGKIELGCKTPGVVNEVLAGGKIEIYSAPNVLYKTVATTSNTNNRLEPTVLINGTCNSAVCFDKIESLGAVKIDASDASVKVLRSGGEINCSNATAAGGFAIALTGATAKSFEGCAGVAEAKKTTVTGMTLQTAVPVISKWSLAPVEVDVWKYEAEANYVVSVNSNGIIEVVVNQVNGIKSGIYVLGKSNVANAKPSRRYLCLKSGPSDSIALAEDVTGTPACSPTYKFCHNTSEDIDCVVKDGNNFAINGTVVPGAFLFKGSLNIKDDQGPYQITATLLATGHITTNGDSQVASLNFAGGPGIDSVATSANTTSQGAARKVGGVCDKFSAADFTLTPSNYCVGKNFVAEPPVLGNIAYMAGGREPLADGTTKAYAGGDIRLGAKNKVFGNVMAGNFVETGGDSWVKGYLSASALFAGTTGNLLTRNSLGAKTLQDLTKLPSTFKPGRMPSGNGGSSVVGKPAQISDSRYR